MLTEQINRAKNEKEGKRLSATVAEIGVELAEGYEVQKKIMTQIQ